MGSYQPKTGAACGCRPGIQRDNCTLCEGTGQRIDFKAIREARDTPTAHTPPPWQHTREVLRGRATQYLEIPGDHGKTVCYFSRGFGMTEEEAEANAEFIIRAVNTHEDMLNALKAILAGWMISPQAACAAIVLHAEPAITKAEDRP